MSANKNILKMNDEQTLSFIGCYEKEEILWNTKLESYRHKDAREEAVNRIVKAMNIKGFRPDHVTSKFKNLRSSYCQELKKIAASEKSGAAAEDIYVPRVVWFNKMNSFLKPFVTMRETYSNYVIPNNKKIIKSEKTNREDPAAIEKNENSRVHESINEAESNILDSVPDSSASSTSSASNISLDQRNKLYQNQRKKYCNLKKRKLEKSKSSSSDIETVLDAAVKKLDDITEKTQNLTQNCKKEDSFDQFGKYIASVLRELPLKNACLLQQNMTTMAMNEIMENEMNRQKKIPGSLKNG